MKPELSYCLAIKTIFLMIVELENGLWRQNKPKQPLSAVYSRKNFLTPLPRRPKLTQTGREKKQKRIKRKADGEQKFDRLWFRVEAQSAAKLKNPRHALWWLTAFDINTEANFINFFAFFYNFHVSLVDGGERDSSRHASGRTLEDWMENRAKKGRRERSSLLVCFFPPPTTMHCCGMAAAQLNVWEI